MSDGKAASPATLRVEKSFSLANSEGYLAVFGNIILAAGKFYIGFTTSSLAIVADAWHTLSDSLSSIILLVGVRIARKPADEEHPFGHGRAEVISALIIGLLLAGIGLEFFHLGIDALRDHEQAEYGPPALILMSVSIVVKELMAQYAFWTARKTNMESLRADGHHHRSDALSSLVLLGGMVFGGRFWFMDGALSMVVALFILYAAWGVMRNACSLLLGSEPDRELLGYLHRIAGELVPGGLELHHVHVHKYGMHMELTFHIRLPGHMSLADAHRVTSRLEKRLYSERHIMATIHAEPLSRTH